MPWVTGVVPQSLSAQFRRLEIDDDGTRTKTRFTLSPAGNQDRTVDLVVVNQGHGDHDQLFDRDDAYWSTNVINPLINSGVHAHIIVLDACLTASMLSTFKPLLTADGTLIVTLYSSTEVLVRADALDPISKLTPRAATNPAAIKRILGPTILRAARIITGGLVDTRLGAVNQADSAVFTRMTKTVKDHPNMKGPLSSVVFIYKILDLIEDYDLRGSLRVTAKLATAVTDNKLVADDEKQLLTQAGVEKLNTGKKQFLRAIECVSCQAIAGGAANQQDHQAQQAIAQLKTLVRARLITLFTRAGVQKQDAHEDWETIPLYTTALHLRSVLGREKALLLGQADLLYPVHFSIYDNHSNKLTYDRLAEDPAVVEQMRSIDDAIVTDIPQIFNKVAMARVINDPQADFPRYLVNLWK